jgi:hypothetical protein
MEENLARTGKKVEMTIEFSALTFDIEWLGGIQGAS